MKIISKIQENCNLEYVRVYTAIRFHPAIFWERWFFDKRNEEKAIVQLGSLGDGGAVSPPLWGAGANSLKVLGSLHSEEL